MAFKQSIAGCFADQIGAGGLTKAQYESWLNRLGPAIADLQEDYAEERLPILRVPEWRDDIAEARAALEKLSRGARNIVFFGTGGSSLGGQTLAQLGGWAIPAENAGEKGERPRVRFYDNLDPRTLERSLLDLDMGGMRFVVISKSGNTPETLVQTLTALQAVKKAGQNPAEIFLCVTEPRVEGVSNALRLLAERENIPILPHHPGIGGRFSGLSNVGMLAALARDLDVEALRRGAKAVVDQMLKVQRPADLPAAVGAAVSVAMSKEKGTRAMVMLPYSDRLGRFAQWYVQLWAESLGKGGEGMTPVAAMGPVDQHSQLQLYLDGPRDHLITVIRQDSTGTGPIIDKELAEAAGVSWLAGRRAGDLVAAQARAIPEALIAAGRPVRVIQLDQLDEEALGGLMMHYMLETILAARLLGVDPFDQPAVEAGKILTKRYLMAAERGKTAATVAG